MMRPTLFHDFLNANNNGNEEEEAPQPPQQVHIRVENNPAPPVVRDLIRQWPVKKVLTARDVNYSQVVMPRDQVEDHILPQLSLVDQTKVNRGEQLGITVRDLDTLTEHRLALWENGSSYVLTSGWSSSFVRRKQLEVSEEVGFCWDGRLKVLRFSVLTCPPAPVPRQAEDFFL